MKDLKIFRANFLYFFSSLCTKYWRQLAREKKPRCDCNCTQLLCCPKFHFNCLSIQKHTIWLVYIICNANIWLNHVYNFGWFLRISFVLMFISSETKKYFLFLKYRKNKIAKLCDQKNSQKYI